MARNLKPRARDANDPLANGNGAPVDHNKSSLAARPGGDGKKMKVAAQSVEAETAAEVQSPKKTGPKSSATKVSAKAKADKTAHKTGGGRGFHNYDKDRKPMKLTKAQKLDLEEWKGNNRFKKRDAYFKAQADVAKAKFGHQSVMAGNESNQLVVGIPMPSLALEWVFVQDVLPLSVVIMLIGRWRTNKSALLYEIFRWFAKANGGAILMENETKFSPDLCSSIMGYSGTDVPIIVNRCNSVEDWQEKLTFYLKDQKSRMIGTQKEPGPGRTIPICFGVDSIMGKSAREKQEKISTDGSASRSYPLEAMLITQYMQSHAHEFDNWPFSLVMVNHEKKAINADTGQSETRKSGGDFVSFQESFELVTSSWKNKIDTADFDGVGTRITCEKNSFGITGRSCKTRMLWWDEVIGENAAGDKVYGQKTVWDWDWATIKMLELLPGKYQKRLKDIDFDLKVKSGEADVECLVHSRALGMGKEEYMLFHEAGALIRENEVLMNRLRTALSIKRRAQLEGDFLEQINRLGDTLV